MSARGNVAGIATASASDGSALDWERRPLSYRGHGWERVERRRNGKAGSLSVISAALDRWTVLCWGVTSAEPTGGAFEERSARCCAAQRFPRVRYRGSWGVFKPYLPIGASGR